MNRITRVEVIDENGRSYVNWEDDNNVSWQFQDDGRTLKVFVNKVKSKTGEEEALESLDKFQNDWLLGKKCPETKLEIKNLNSVESIKAEIKVLQSKLEFYEELEKTKSPAEEAYKEVYGWHPPTTSSVSNYEDNRWRDFQNGWMKAQSKNTEPYCPDEPLEYDEVEWDEKDNPEPETLLDVIRNLGYSYDMCYEIVYAVEEFQKPKEPEDNEWTIEKLQKKNWYVDTKTLLKSNWEPKPKTPEETEKSLREAFQKVQQTEEWKETQRKIDAPKESWMNKSDEELVAILEKNPPEFLKFELGKTLEGLIEEWWIDVFTRNSDLSMEESIDCLVTMICYWLPKEQSAAGSQSLGVEDMVEGFNDCLKKIKSKLRNKKDT